MKNTKLLLLQTLLMLHYILYTQRDNNCAVIVTVTRTNF